MTERYSLKMLASVYGVSEATIRRNVAQMKKTGRWPKAIIRSGGVWVDPVAYEDFLCRKEMNPERRTSGGREKGSCRLVG